MRCNHPAVVCDMLYTTTNTITTTTPRPRPQPQPPPPPPPPLPLTCLAGDETWLQLEACLRDQLGRLQLLLRSGASPAAAAAAGGGGGCEEGAGLGAQLGALELALAQQEKVGGAWC
jgi:hypothetical protein